MGPGSQERRIASTLVAAPPSVARRRRRCRDADFLRRQGCDEDQGYLLARPMPADEFAGLLRTHRPTISVVRPTNERLAWSQVLGGGSRHPEPSNAVTSASKLASG